MYIEKLSLSNIRTFLETDMEFVHPDLDFRKHDPGITNGTAHPLPRPKLPNVNLLLGDNGSGKTTILQAIALATLGPAAREAQLPLRRFIRSSIQDFYRGSEGSLLANFRLHVQEDSETTQLNSPIQFQRKGELEQIISIPDVGTDLLWKNVYHSNNTAFFCVGYGPTRRVETDHGIGITGQPKTGFVRGQRMQSLFQESFPLFPLNYWLPEIEESNSSRYKEILTLLNRFLIKGHYRFNGSRRWQEYTFERVGGGVHVPIPFSSLSDGYRAFIGWVADLLYHLNFACSSNDKLTDVAGIVMVDEIDLHLHPKWQMTVIRSIAKALPRMQFIFTSHSPLVASSLEWMNIISLKSTRNNKTKATRLKQSLHGLDADQVLLTDYFGLTSTRAKSKRDQLDQLIQKARSGDDAAAREIIIQLSKGTEEGP